MIWKNVRERKGLYMGLTHFDENGKAVMVDVTDKKETAREAVAEGKILVNRDVFQAVKAGTVGKGDVLAVAATAGIAGAKRTSDLIPMCHILPLTNCKVDFRMNEKECAIFCTCTVKVTGKTGVEMEALTGVSAALLTIYDMCKALDKKMEITDIRLLKKTGGKSGDIWNDFDRCAGLVGENLSAENRSAGNGGIAGRSRNLCHDITVFTDKSIHNRRLTGVRTAYHCKTGNIIIQNLRRFFLEFTDNQIHQITSSTSGYGRNTIRIPQSQFIEFRSIIL